MNKCKCNGAGEMPGHEGEDRQREDFNEFVEANEEDIIFYYIESLVDSLEITDVPDSFIQGFYEDSQE